MQMIEQFEVALVNLFQQAWGAPSLLKEPKISLITKFDCTWSQFRDF